MSWTRTGVRVPPITGPKELFQKLFSNFPVLKQETEATRKLYGIGEGRTDDFGRKCLLARRMVESGVRFVEINHSDWGHHADVSTKLPKSCASVDKPICGLLTDLKARGLLDDTLVIWGGEFGRTPHAEGDGRDHNVKAFTMWMAGGGWRVAECEPDTPTARVTITDARPFRERSRSRIGTQRFST